MENISTIGTLAFNGIGSAWNAWYCNKQIDQVAKGLAIGGARKGTDMVAAAEQGGA